MGLIARPGSHLGTASKTAALLLATVATLSLWGCKAGSGGGDEQQPDPVVVDLPIAYIQRSLPMDEDGELVSQELLAPADFHPGAELFLKDRATPGAAATNLTANLFAEGASYDIKSLTVAADGRRLAFALRAPEIANADDDEQPSWNIWEYNLDSRELRRVIASDINAEAGDDIDPAYLPDGRIVFASTRQRRSKAILLDDNKPQFTAQTEDRNSETFLLHVMEADGSDIQQLTFNQSHDLQPTVLNDGRILFNRWDNLGGRNRVSLYTIKPDGSELALLYGYHSQNTGTNNAQVSFQRPQEMSDGRILVSLKPRSSQRYGGDLVAIDADNFIDANQPVAANLGDTGSGQQALTELPVSSDESISSHGAFSSVYPFADGSNRLLVSWSQCRLIDPDSGAYVACDENGLADPDAEEAPPLYGLWIYDLDTQSQQPLIPPTEGLMISAAVTLEPRLAPDYIPPPVSGIDLDSELVDAGLGTLHIRSVYDFDGVDSTPAGIGAMADPAQTPVAARPARFVRIVKAVSMPDDDVLDFDNSAFGRSSQQLMREIIGYVPVEPDGSVTVKVPADIAFMISVLDSSGKRLGERHQNWLQLRPGEERECAGCHSANSALPHGRPDAEAASANPGALTTGSPFPNSEPALFADAGESMAQTYRRLNGARTPSTDIVFDDQWTDPSDGLNKAASFAYRYTDLATPAPVSDSCQSNWNALCRTTIHYPLHIQPLWNLDRRIFDEVGNLLEDRTCTSCHNSRDANDMLQVPEAQLDLSDAASPDAAEHLVSYRELLFPDAEQTLDDNGALVDLLEPLTDANGNPVFLTDAEGELILDANEEPIQVMVTVTINPLLSPAGARASGAFYLPFGSGGNHQDWLSAAELRLLSEWLDIGAQYYNNPFAAPGN
ncbi:hypothetical protein G8764_10750 [Pseudomaricurvus alcaniphilus]|uniref:HzsA-related protein n=1 Tax=Pseudomaricurvus alcaniphilus TaxID=1166482 RepID=UPI00140BE7FA|nr:PD40 domain-containing protein [Pseudomaricurvus alcaniphilus]NHN37775.1 hypothetical protein [Pseudomaricurvus alcaniphilus]